MKLLRTILWPVLWVLSMIYSAVVRLRNYLYDSGLRRSVRFGFPVICVGNITVGGTGKTPLIELLAERLTAFQPALVSRGYRRRTKGMVVATASSTAADIGDEPMQIMQKFPNMTIIADGNRRRAIEWIEQNAHSQLVLMDDGFQHRSVAAGLNIVVMDYARPLWRDHVFPLGRMREPQNGLCRADMVVVNKCPADLGETEREYLRSKISSNGKLPVFFSAIQYSNLRRLGGEEVELKPRTPIVAVAGIGRPEPFFEHICSRFEQVICLPFADHCNFTPADMAKITSALEAAGPDAALVLTEKDSKRFPLVGNTPIYYLPIKLVFLFGQDELFNQKIEEYVSKNRRSS